MAARHILEDLHEGTWCMRPRRHLRSSHAPLSTPTLCVLFVDVRQVSERRRIQTDPAENREQRGEPCKGVVCVCIQNGWK